jgi:type I pantothenate kinase
LFCRFGRGVRQLTAIARFSQPDILIFEGLNVLQAGLATGQGGRPRTIFVSDFFDFFLHVDADEADIQAWYIERFLLLQRTAFQKPSSYFHHHKDLPEDQAREVARQIWTEINQVNLRENIFPTRERAHLVLRKRRDRAVGEVWLRQI